MVEAQEDGWPLALTGLARRAVPPARIHRENCYGRPQEPKMNACLSVMANARMKRLGVLELLVE